MKDTSVLLVVGDSGDGNYVHSETEIDDSWVDLDRIRRIASSIRAVGSRHNWDNRKHEVYRNVLTTDDIDYFNEFAPSGPDGELNTITSIRIIKTVEVIL